MDCVAFGEDFSHDNRVSLHEIFDRLKAIDVKYNGTMRPAVRPSDLFKFKVPMRVIRLAIENGLIEVKLLPIHGKMESFCILFDKEREK